MANTELGSVTLSGRFTWTQRQVNKLVGLRKAASALCNYGLNQQQVVIRNTDEGFRYWHAPSRRFVEIPGAKGLGTSLQDNVKEVVLPGGSTPAQIKSILYSLLTNPIEDIWSNLAAHGIKMKGASGEDFKVPVSWNDLYNEIVPTSFGEMYELGCMASVAIAVLGGISWCTHDLATGSKTSIGMLALSAGASVVAGFLLVSVVRGTIWASTKLSRMANFSRDYRALLDGCNAIGVTQNTEARIQSVLKRAKNSRATIAHALSYELAEKHLAGSDKDSLLVTHPQIPKNKLIELSAISKTDSIGTLAARALKERLTLSDSGQLQIIKVVLENHLSLDEQRDRETLINIIGEAQYSEIREFAWEKIAPSATADELDQINTSDVRIIKMISEHPKVIPQTIAFILSNQNVIPKSKKVVDCEAETKQETEWQGEYVNSLETRWEECLIAVEVSPERSHQEYESADIDKAIGFLQNRDPRFISQVMEILEATNPELHEKLAVRLP